MQGEDSIRVKGAEEIIAELREIIHRHRRRFLRKHTRPCPINCTFATESNRRGVTGCTGCDSVNPEVCRSEGTFIAISTKEEIAEQFKHHIRDPNTLRHEFRDVMTLLWVLGQFDGEAVEEEVIATAEKHVHAGKA